MGGPGSGGKRQGAGRKRRLTPAERKEVARQYDRRMQAYAAAQAHARDSNIKERREINNEMRDKAAKHKVAPGDAPGDSLPGEDVIWAHKHVLPEIKKLQAKLDSIPNKSAATPRRAKGPRERFLQELANEWKISTQTVVRCISEEIRRREAVEAEKRRFLNLVNNRK
jgi:hypothetical protein